MIDWPYQWDKAEKSLRRAIGIAPGNAIGHKYLGDHLSYIGRLDEGIAELRLATELDPYDANTWLGLGISQMAARQLDSAVASYRHALSVDVGLAYTRELQATAFVLQGEADSALRVLSLRSDSSADELELYFRAYVWARAGQRARAESVARAFEERARSSPKFIGLAAYVYLGLGDSTRALDWFIRMADARERPNYLASPEFDPIRALPRYPELLRKFNLQDQPVAKLKARGR